MPSVHYKFKSSLDYKTLMFEGIQISVGELKKLIYENEKIGKSADFDLQITNAQTKQVYEDESAAVQRNASVIVARVPTAIQQKLPKVWDTRNEGKVIRTPTVFQTSRSVASMLPERNDLTKSNLSEDDKLALMQNEATQDYDPSQYQRGRHAVRSGPAPPTLQCKKCGQSGHWIKDCPLLNVRRPTGIPKDELMETTPDDPQAMLTPSGRYVVAIMDKQAHLIGKKERPPFFEEETPIVEPEPKRDIPSELTCPLCTDLLREAVVIRCCGYSFCDECIRNRLLESEQHECPHCREKGIPPDSLVPNSQLRKAVTNFRNETGYVYARRQRLEAASTRAGQTQSNTSTSNRLKINLVTAGIARANAAEKKLRSGSVGSDATSSPVNQATGGNGHSPDTRERDSPVVTTTVTTSTGGGSIGYSSSSGPYRPTTFTRSMAPSTHMPTVKIIPSGPPPPMMWPPTSMPTPMVNMPPIHSVHLSNAPSATAYLQNFHPHPHPHPHPPPQQAVPVAAPPPVVRYPPTQQQQQQMAHPGPPGVAPASHMSSYPTQMNSFMGAQPPPPGVPPSMSVGSVSGVAPGFGMPRGPTFLPPQRRPLTEAEFYDAKRRMLENRFRHRSPRPQDAWEEFLARKDKKRRRSSTRSPSSSRSRSRSSRSRSHSVSRSRSPSRSPSYRSRRRRRRERSRSSYSRSRGRSRSRTPRSPHSSRRYHRRSRHSSPRSRSRPRKNASPSTSKGAKWSPPRHHAGGTHRTATSNSTDFAPANTTTTADKRSTTLSSFVGYAAAPQSTSTSTNVQTSVQHEINPEAKEKVAKEAKREEKEKTTKEEKEKAAKEEKPSKEDVAKDEKEKVAKGDEAAKESKSAKEDKSSKSRRVVKKENEKPKIVKEEKTEKEVEERKDVEVPDTKTVTTKEEDLPGSSLAKEEPSIPNEEGPPLAQGDDDEQAEKKKKVKREKKKKKKHHKTSKKRHQDDDETKDSQRKEKSEKKDDKSKRPEKIEKRSSEEEKSDKKERKHKNHKREKRKSETSQTEPATKRKRRT